MCFHKIGASEFKNKIGKTENFTFAPYLDIFGKPKGRNLKQFALLKSNSATHGIMTA